MRRAEDRGREHLNELHVVGKRTDELDAGLIDEYQIVMSPIALGNGRTLFEDAKRKLPMKLTGSRAFGNGNVLLSYASTA